MHCNRLLDVSCKFGTENAELLKFSLDYISLNNAIYSVNIVILLLLLLLYIHDPYTVRLLFHLNDKTSDNISIM